MGQEDERTGGKARAETDSKAAIQTFKQHPIKCDDISPTFSENRRTIFILINLVNNNFSTFIPAQMLKKLIILFFCFY